MKLSQLFEEEPEQWGYRGDPHLWRELRTYFETQEYEGSVQQLKPVIVNAFEKITQDR